MKKKDFSKPSYKSGTKKKKRSYGYGTMKKKKK